MSERENVTPEPSTGRSPAERAQHLVDQFGQRLNAARAQRAARSQATDGQVERPATERAEEMLDRVGEQLGRWTAQATTQARRFAARAREEAEDIWAEAQSKSHHESPPPAELSEPSGHSNSTH